MLRVVYMHGGAGDDVVVGVVVFWWRDDKHTMSPDVTTTPPTTKAATVALLGVYGMAMPSRSRECVRQPVVRAGQAAQCVTHNHTDSSHHNTYTHTHTTHEG